MERLAISSAATVVGVGDLGVSRSGALITHGLGSCIAVCVRLPDHGVGAILHFMLPSSRIDPTRAATRPHLFADTGIADMFGQLQTMASCDRTEIKLVGGASTGLSPQLGVGRRNLLAARKQFWARGYAILGEETEGSISRTVRFDVTTGVVRISTPGLPERSL